MVQVSRRDILCRAGDASAVPRVNLPAEYVAESGMNLNMRPCFLVNDEQDKVLTNTIFERKFTKRSANVIPFIAYFTNIVFGKLCPSIAFSFHSARLAKSARTSRVIPHHISTFAAWNLSHFDRVMMHAQSTTSLGFTTNSAHSCSFVKLLMLNVVCKLKVLGAVIRFYVINMVNNFLRGEFPPENALHHQPMFRHISVIRMCASAFTKNQFVTIAHKCSVFVSRICFGMCGDMRAITAQAAWVCVAISKRLTPFTTRNTGVHISI
jgi:hypothetical protein